MSVHQESCSRAHFSTPLDCRLIEKLLAYCWNPLRMLLPPSCTSHGYFTTLLRKQIITPTIDSVVLHWECFHSAHSFHQNQQKGSNINSVISLPMSEQSVWFTVKNSQLTKVIFIISVRQKIFEDLKHGTSRTPQVLVHSMLPIICSPNWEHVVSLQETNQVILTRI